MLNAARSALLGTLKARARRILFDWITDSLYEIVPNQRPVIVREIVYRVVVTTPEVTIRLKETT